MRVVAVLLALIVAAVALTLPSWNRSNGETFQGWVEADLIFVSPDEAGRIETLSVREGSAVELRAPLFTLDDDLQKAEVNQVNAQVTNARQTLDRAQQLLKSNAGTQRAYDDAEMTVRTAEARLNSSQTRLARRKVFSPVAGTVQQVYFRQGEMVAAGRPVLAILPPANVKIRFFVSETRLPQIAIGDRVRIRCDGCAGELEARVSFMSRTAEYTPPVIYSQEERSKLVFMIEARPEHGEDFRVGQPVSVTLAPPGTEARR
ncbi:MAG: HlyD family secretion protein [Xanthobacteraceae bacterium]|jgi:HlyD family secretion protein